MLVVVLVLENPDRFEIRLIEQISCRKSASLRSRNPNAPRTSTIPNFGIWVEMARATQCGSNRPLTSQWLVGLHNAGCDQAGQ